MAEQNFKIVETNYNLNDFESIRKDLLNFEFFEQNLNTHRICTKHKAKDEYRVMSDDNKKFFLILDNKESALAFLNAYEKLDHRLLETDFQEEIEQITSENIEKKAEEFLDRFNKKFNLDVVYNPSEADIEEIDRRVKKTIWDKENLFLLNFYMMAVTKRKFNFSEWKFEKINTFNPFYVPQYVGRNDSVNTYYSILNPKTRKHFNFKLYIGL